MGISSLRLHFYNIKVNQINCGHAEKSCETATRIYKTVLRQFRNYQLVIFS
jgi:hypothetical protein